MVTHGTDTQSPIDNILASSTILTRSLFALIDLDVTVLAGETRLARTVVAAHQVSAVEGGGLIAATLFTLVVI